MKNLCVFGLKLFFFIKASLREAKESIGSSIDLALLIIDLKMILGELLGLPDLIRAQILCVHKPMEVVMVD